MTCSVLAMGKQHLGPHVVVGYGIKIFWPGLFITSPDHLGKFVPIFRALARDDNCKGAKSMLVKHCVFVV